MDAYRDKSQFRPAATYAEVICSDEGEHTSSQKIARWLLFVCYAVPLALLTLPTVLFPFLVLGDNWPIPGHTDLTRAEYQQQKRLEDRQVMTQAQGYTPTY